MTAIIIGASGLIGSAVLEILLQNPAYTKVYALLRKPLPISHPKLEMLTVDFKNPEQFRAAMPPSDVVFSTIGTTMKKVHGDKELYRSIDYDIPVQAAQNAKEKGCQKFLIVSALGADSKSSNFYMRLKGEIDDTLKAMNFPSLYIFRPSLLIGDRKEKRFGEKLGEIIMKPLSLLLPARMKPVEATAVAQAMTSAATSNERGTHICYYSDIQRLIRR